MTKDQARHHRLKLVDSPPTAEPDGGHGAALAALLRAIADLAEGQEPWELEGLSFDPIAAVVIVPLTAHGEPAIVSAGMGPAAMRPEAWAEISDDISDALNAWRRGGAPAVRTRWLRHHNRRHQDHHRKLAGGTYRCERCDSTFKTSWGLDRHRRTSCSTKRA